ncbi:MAG: desulfoferrodoxin [Candidatus Heimdallarchaeota archaeon]
MPNRYEIYKCNRCGNIIDVLDSGQGTLVCCGAPMIHVKEQTADWKTEKHVPVVKQIEERKVRVTVGSTPHPMEEDHYIQWVEVIDGEKYYRRYLKPGDKPASSFYVKYPDKIIAREFCNKHGLWTNNEAGLKLKMGFKNE